MSTATLQPGEGAIADRPVFTVTFVCMGNI